MVTFHNSVISVQVVIASPQFEIIFSITVASSVFLPSMRRHIAYLREHAASYILASLQRHLCFLPSMRRHSGTTICGTAQPHPQRRLRRPGRGSGSPGFGSPASGSPGFGRLGFGRLGFGCLGFGSPGFGSPGACRKHLPVRGRGAGAARRAGERRCLDDARA